MTIRIHHRLNIIPAQVLAATTGETTIYDLDLMDESFSGANVGVMFARIHSGELTNAPQVHFTSLWKSDYPRANDPGMIYPSSESDAVASVAASTTPFTIAAGYGIAPGGTVFDVTDGTGIAAGDLLCLTPAISGPISGLDWVKVRRRDTNRIYLSNPVLNAHGPGERVCRAEVWSPRIEVPGFYYVCAANPGGQAVIVQVDVMRIQV